MAFFFFNQGVWGGREQRQAAAPHSSTARSGLTSRRRREAFWLHRLGNQGGKLTGSHSHSQLEAVFFSCKYFHLS